jgi:hypothetical protein
LRSFHLKAEEPIFPSTLRKAAVLLCEHYGLKGLGSRQPESQDFVRLFCQLFQPVSILEQIVQGRLAENAKDSESRLNGLWIFHLDHLS